MSTGGRDAGVLGGGEGVDDVAAGGAELDGAAADALVTGAGVAVSDCGYVTGGDDVSEPAGEEPAGAGAPRVEPDGVALGDT
jgi:hypothetical protein